MTTIRREIRRLTTSGPAPFSSAVTIVSITELSPGFRRITVEGDGLAAYGEPRPADAFKLMLPPGGSGPVHFPERGGDGLPYWPEGARRPLLRAYTVRRWDAHARRISFDVTMHAGGLAMTWLAQARTGDVIGLSGMRREFHAGDGVDRHLIVGDASALPAIASILESLDGRTPVSVHAAVGDVADRVLLPLRDNVRTRWITATAAEAGPALDHAVRDTERAGGRLQAWLACEAAAVRSIRRFAANDLGVDRDDLFSAAYWKAGQDSTVVDAKLLRAYQNEVAAGADVRDPDVRERVESRI